MAITDNIAAGLPILLSAPAAVTGDLSLDILSNLSIVGVLWYFNKKTESRNEKIENEIRDQEKAHKSEIKEERQRFETLLKEQRENTTENIEKIVILHQQSEKKADARQPTLLNNSLDALRKSITRLNYADYDNYFATIPRHYTYFYSVGRCGYINRTFVYSYQRKALRARNTRTTARSCETA